MKSHIAAVIMVKNESLRLMVTLDSLVGLVDSIVVYDTGSTDNTLEILRKFSEDTGIMLRLLEGHFVDFSTSRNTMLDFADTFDDIDYLMFLDCNDELRDVDGLIRKTIESEKDTSVFLFTRSGSIITKLPLITLNDL